MISQLFYLRFEDVVDSTKLKTGLTAIQLASVPIMIACADRYWTSHVLVAPMNEMINVINQMW